MIKKLMVEQAQIEIMQLVDEIANQAALCETQGKQIGNWRRPRPNRMVYFSQAAKLWRDKNPFCPALR